MEKFKYSLGFLMVLILMFLTINLGFRLAFNGMIFPRIKIAGIEVTGMDQSSAQKLVASYFETQPTQVILMSEGKEISSLSGLEIKHDPSWAAEQAFSSGRNGNILTQITEEIKILVYGRDIQMPTNFDMDELNNTIDQLVENYDQKPIWPNLIKEAGVIKLVKGKNGVEIRKQDLVDEVIKAMSLPGTNRVEIRKNQVITTENPEMVKQIIQVMNKRGETPLTIHFRGFNKEIKQEEILSLLGVVSDRLNEENFKTLVEEIKPEVEMEPKDAVFIFENNKVNEFKPEVIGATIDIPTFKDKLAEAILKDEAKDLEIPVILSYPKIKTGDINNLGIKELIGTGKSTFFHSIPGRVFNVNLAASRVNGTLVAPGDEFSFDDAVGEISKTTGYQTAYIISQGRTVLGDGGGVCQVSTTTFRAALNAGLPITERKAHAYRVGYYEQDSPPGIDATIFSPSADLRFLNDTGHYILIQEVVDTKKLAMTVNIYGTSDGRKSTISKPRISNQTPPPPTIYVDDPTLPMGATKQVDWSAWGAKVSFDYQVEKAGVITYQKTFFSNYQAWQAVYLRGVGK